MATIQQGLFVVVVVVQPDRKLLSPGSPGSSLQDRKQRLLTAHVGLGRRSQSTWVWNLWLQDRYTSAACCVTVQCILNAPRQRMSIQKKRTTNLKTTSRNQHRLENKQTSDSMSQFLHTSIATHVASMANMSSRGHASCHVLSVLCTSDGCQ